MFFSRGGFAPIKKRPKNNNWPLNQSEKGLLSLETPEDLSFLPSLGNKLCLSHHVTAETLKEIALGALGQLRSVGQSGDDCSPDSLVASLVLSLDLCIVVIQHDGKGGHKIKVMGGGEQPVFMVFDPCARKNKYYPLLLGPSSKMQSKLSSIRNTMPLSDASVYSKPVDLPQALAAGKGLQANYTGGLEPRCVDSTHLAEKAEEDQPPHKTRRPSDEGYLERPGSQRSQNMAGSKRKLPPPIASVGGPLAGDVSVEKPDEKTARLK